MAKTFSQRPSNFLEIEGNWVAYDFDSAVWAFGSYVEGQLDKVEQDAMASKSRPSTKAIVKRKSRKLEKLLGVEQARPRHKTSIQDVLKIGGVIIPAKD